MIHIQTPLALNKIKKLRYDLKYVKSGQIISEILCGSLIKIEAKGVENIPKSGPCIIIPYHYPAQLDPMILISIINRKLFFAASVEGFISIPFLDSFWYKMGCLPIKRDDSEFNKRINGSVPSKKIDNYNSSNLDSIKKMLTHLKYGDPIVIFPEGDAKINATYDRPNNEKFLEPKEGFVSIAFLAKRKFNLDVPIIPVGLKYNGRLMKRVVIKIGSPHYLDNSLQKMKKKELKNTIDFLAKKIFDDVKMLSS